MKMMNPMGSMPTVPGTEEKSEEPGLTREELKEQERLRKEAIMIADREGRMKYKKQEEQRESVRQNLRDKYKIAKPEQESESEDEDDDDVFGPSSRRKENGNWSEDPVAQAQKLAEKQLNEAKSMAQEKCSIQ